MSRRAFLPAMLAGCLLACGPLFAGGTHYEGRNRYLAPKSLQPVVIDGVADDAVWQSAEWHEIDQLWLGPEYTADDFSGRFKVAWSEQRLYILVEVVDDILFDSHRDPLVQYWDDDCLEIFVDEDPQAAIASGAGILGVNARDLATFEMRLDRVEELVAEIPASCLRVAESGIHTPEDVKSLADAGVDAILVGEALVTAPDQHDLELGEPGREPGHGPQDQVDLAGNAVDAIEDIIVTVQLEVVGELVEAALQVLPPGLLRHDATGMAVGLIGHPGYRGGYVVTHIASRFGIFIEASLLYQRVSVDT